MGDLHALPSTLVSDRCEVGWGVGEVENVTSSLRVFALSEMSVKTKM